MLDGAGRGQPAGADVDAAAPVVPGFLRAAATKNFTGSFPDPTLSDTLYTYAWFVTFGLGFIIYYVLMTNHPSLKGEAGEVPTRTSTR